jgi:hypothetical protein
LTTRSEAAPVANPRAQAVFDRLIASYWCNQQVMTSGFGDYTGWELRPDGTYRYDAFTDTVPWPHGEGRWRLEPTSHGWVLVLEGAARRRLTMHGDGWIAIDELELRACRPTGAVSRNVETLEPIELPPNVRALRDAVAWGSWTRMNDLDPGWRPTSVRFRSDWTFVSEYRNGACKNLGTWTVAGRGEIRGFSPRNACDERDRSYQQHLTAVRLSDDLILIGGDLHIRGAALPARGVIWKLQGYEDAVDVRVDYPMPLKRGKPASFAFTFHNVSDEPRTLERIALNRVYRDYRYRTRGMETPEIAARDLERRQLLPGESWDVAVEAEFEQAGEQDVYFDALIAGSRQNWDVRQARRVSVHP